LEGGKLVLDLSNFEMDRDGHVQIARIENVHQLIDETGGTSQGDTVPSGTANALATLTAKVNELMQAMEDYKLMKEA
jgi:hypothetical protein